MNKDILKRILPLLLLFILVFPAQAKARRDAAPPPPPPRQALAPPETVGIYSFNIQVFGAAKMAKPGVKEILADIVSRTDICAIQEYRSQSPKPLEDFMALLPERYSYVMGRREGRSSSKEQYIVIYDSAKFHILGMETYPDPGDRFERDPLGIYFKSKSKFDFILINNHISPGDAANEIAALPEVAAWFADLWGEKDVITLGDFNADGQYYNEALLAEVFPPGEFYSLIYDDLDTTVAASANTYDRIIISSSALEDFAGPVGVLRFDEEKDFPASDVEARTVSDHYPVWAQFFIDFDTD